MITREIHKIDIFSKPNDHDDKSEASNDTIIHMVYTKKVAHVYLDN